MGYRLWYQEGKNSLEIAEKRIISADKKGMTLTWKESKMKLEEKVHLLYNSCSVSLVIKSLEIKGRRVMGKTDGD